MKDGGPRPSLILPLVIAAIFPFCLTFGYFILGRGNSGIAKTCFLLGKTLQFVFPALWTAWILKERVLIRKFNKQGFWEGGLFGLIVFTFMLIGFWLLGSTVLAESFHQLKEELGLRLQSFNLLNPIPYLLVLVFYSICHSGLEEYYWRWFVSRRLEEILPPVCAIFLASLGFTLHHILILGCYFGFGHWLTWTCVFGVFIGGVYWSFLYRRSDSIWGCWFSHGLIDAAIFAIGFLILF